MNLLDRAGLPPAPDGGPPLEIDRRLLDAVPCATVLGPIQLLAERLSIRCEDEELGQFLAAFVAAFPRVTEAGAVLHVVSVGGCWAAYLDGRRTVSADWLAGIARWLVLHLNTIALAAPTDDMLVHAAVASLGGRAVIFPGRSGAGKTTLVAALTLTGWAYLSDEVAPLSPTDDIVHPYPRPLALEPGSWDLVPEAIDRWPHDVPHLVTDLKLVLPATIGSPVAPTSARLAAIVFPEVVKGSVTQVLPIGKAEALERLVPLTFNLPDLSVAGFEGLALHVRRTPCHRVILDGVQAAPSVLRALIEGRITRAESP